MHLSIGDSASLQKVMLDEDLQLFAKLSLDTNPIHSDEQFASQTRFGRRICPGMLYSSLISAVIGTKLPGPGTIYVKQTLRFLKPVFINDEVTAIVSVAKILPSKQMAILSTKCFNQHQVAVISGEAVVLLPNQA
ncbi:MaoC family dehydratase [Hymenobacter sp. YC55]|uniref:MaoC family dehydratase n=1 Tax=Hymenobacter sp. YC55 TaxID=3034019 RepID=UPI0023F9DDE5|nr:MaoC family dehydratase [Hymenobacter sp. YC55]MDF7811130.1 MaoC family dehydratase [Hymenobacter sp. YC55]